MLDTLGWRWGPAHIEVKRTSRGPVLVEVNAGRFNGASVWGTSTPDTRLWLCMWSSSRLHMCTCRASLALGMASRWTTRPPPCPPNAAPLSVLQAPHLDHDLLAGPE